MWDIVKLIFVISYASKFYENIDNSKVLVFHSPILHHLADVFVISSFIN
jgi:hypothetical protein